MNDNISHFIGKVNGLIVQPIIDFIFALAITYFLYGVFEFLSNQESEEKKTSGRNHMFWGVIGITIMMAVWNILGLLLSTLDIPKSQIDPKNGTVRPWIKEF